MTSRDNQKVCHCAVARRALAGRPRSKAEAASPSHRTASTSRPTGKAADASFHVAKTLQRQWLLNGRRAHVTQREGLCCAIRVSTIHE